MSDTAPPETITYLNRATVRDLLPKVHFDDGRATNRESTVKHNLQAPQEDPANAAIASMPNAAAI